MLGSYIRIEGLRIYGYEDRDDPGMEINECHHIDIWDNEIAFCGGGGVNFKHCDTIRVIGNEIHGNAYRNIDQHSGISVFQPIPFDDPEGRYWSIEIRRNHCYRNHNYNPRPYGTTDGNGIILDDYYYTQQQFLLDWHRDRIGNATPYRGRTLVEGNLCRENGGTGILCFLTDGVQIKNNTLVGNNQGIFNGDGSFRNRGQLCMFDSDNAYLLNNILMSTAVEAASEYEGTPYAAVQMGGTGVFWENNMFYSSTGSSFLMNQDHIGFRGLFGNPNFRNPVALDYRSDLGRNRGITWTGGHVYESFNSKEIRTGASDIGAFEF